VQALGLDAAAAAAPSWPAHARGAREEWPCRQARLCRAPGQLAWCGFKAPPLPAPPPGSTHLEQLRGGTCVAPPRRRHLASARRAALGTNRPASPCLCGGRACSCTMRVLQGQGVLPLRVRPRALLRPRWRVPGLGALCGKICAASSGGSCGLLGSLREASQAPQGVSGCSVWPGMRGAAPCIASASGTCAPRAPGAALGAAPAPSAQAARAVPGAARSHCTSWHLPADLGRLPWRRCCAPGALCAHQSAGGACTSTPPLPGIVGFGHWAAAVQKLCGYSGGREIAATS